MNNIVNIKAAQYEPPVLIHYVQGSTEIPLEFNITDYEIPSGSTARIYLKRPDGTESYNDCTIDGNVITYKPTAQFFSVAGICTGQLQIMIGDDFLVTFPLVFDVAENIIDNSAIESSNEYGALEALLQKAQENIPAAGEAAKAANKAAQSANNAANAANTAAGKANTAKNAANSAASAANTAAGQANTAAGAANTAANRANQAAGDAEKIMEKLPDIENYPFYPYYGSGTDDTVTPGMGMLAEVAGGRTTFTNNEATQIGYLRISLPEEPTKTKLAMIAFDVLIASYTNSATGVYSIQGELYRSGTTEQDGWASQSAVFIGKHDTGIADLPVVFGMDPTTYRRYVQIGNVDTDWGYGCAVIKNVRSYWNAYGANNWKEGWSIEITTEPLPGVTISDDPTIIQPITAGGTGGTTQLEAADSLGVPSLVNGTVIAKNADLNTVIEIGNYRCIVISTVATLKNCPTTQTFKLYVENSVLLYGGNYRTQTIIDIDGTVYTRYTANLGTSWTAWKYLDGMTDDEYEQLYTALGLSVE